MRKILLLSIALLACIMPVEAKRQARAADAKGTRYGWTLPTNVSKMLKAPAATAAGDESTYELRFCNDLYSWYKLTDESNVTYRIFLYIDEDIATQLAGNKLTEINFCPLVQSRIRTTGTVFVSEDIEGDPVTSKSATISKGSPQNPKVYTVALDEPYTIKAGQGFFFGYTVEKCNKNDYPIGVDEGPATAYAGYVETIINGVPDEEGIYPIGYENVNVFLYATTEGAATGLTDLIDYQYSILGDFTLPTVTAGEPVPVYSIFTNSGDNAITSVDYTVTCVGGQTVSGTATADVAPKSTGVVVLEGPAIEAGRQVIDITIHKANTVEFEEAEDQAECLAVAVDNQFERKFVTEEFTGTWCGYCPVGIVAMDYMSKTYPDNFIGIAIHGDDEFESKTYAPLLGLTDGFPNSLVNRDLNWMVYPMDEELEEAYQYWEAFNPGAAEIKLSVSRSKDNEIEATTRVKFGFDQEDANYAIAFVVIENDLESIQTNYFPQIDGFNLPGWTDNTDSVVWKYTDTARNIYDILGINGSVPEKIESGKAYRFSYDVPMTDVDNIDNIAIIALLCDGETGTILNADRVYADEFSGIEDIITDNNAINGGATVIYNLAGQRINESNVAPGFYIIKSGNKTTKVLVK